MVGSNECSSGNVGCIADLPQDRLIDILNSDDLIGNRVAALKCLKSQKARDLHGRKLLESELGREYPRFRISVISMMSERALDGILEDRTFQNERIKQEVLIVYFGRSAVQKTLRMF